MQRFSSVRRRQPHHMRPLPPTKIRVQFNSCSLLFLQSGLQQLRRPELYAKNDHRRKPHQSPVFVDCFRFYKAIRRGGCGELVPTQGTRLWDCAATVPDFQQAFAVPNIETKIIFSISNVVASQCGDTPLRTELSARFRWCGVVNKKRNAQVPPWEYTTCNSTHSLHYYCTDSACQSCSFDSAADRTS